MKTEENLLGKSLSKKLMTLGYWSESCKYGWFKVGRKMELKPMTPTNLLAYPYFIFAPTLEQARRWCRNVLKVYPIVSYYQYITGAKHIGTRYEVDMYELKENNNSNFIECNCVVDNNKKQAFEKGIKRAIQLWEWQEYMEL